MDKTSAQQHLDDVGRHSLKAGELLSSATRILNYSGADLSSVALTLQAAGVYAQLANTAAIAAQAAMFLPATEPEPDDQEQ